MLHLTLHEENTAGGGGVVITGRWEKIAPPPTDGNSQMHPAAYHSALAIGPERDALLLYGGMAGGRAVQDVTVINLRSSEVFHPDQDEVDAPAPHGRYGAAVHDIGEKMWVIGGCSGVGKIVSNAKHDIYYPLFHTVSATVFPAFPLPY